MPRPRPRPIAAEALGDRLSLQIERLRLLAEKIAHEDAGDASILADILVVMLDDHLKPLIAEVHALDRSVRVAPMERAR